MGRRKDCIDLFAEAERVAVYGEVGMTAEMFIKQNATLLQKISKCPCNTIKPVTQRNPQQ